MNDDASERELNIDELQSVSGGGVIMPLTQRARHLAKAHADGGVCDDSV